MNSEIKSGMIALIFNKQFRERLYVMYFLFTSELIENRTLLKLNNYF